MSQDFSRFSGTGTYITSPELRHAVDVAVAIQRPLLVRGEPGTGKTLLATAVAEDLELELIAWNVKSTSKAADGLYVYDTVMSASSETPSRPRASDEPGRQIGDARMLMTLLSVVLLGVCGVIIFLVLSQDTRGGGLAGALGGGMGQGAFGGRSVESVTKMTAWAAVAFFVLVLSMGLLHTGSGGGLTEADADAESGAPTSPDK